MEVNEELWTLEVSRCDANIVLSFRMIKLGETPIDKSQLKVVRIGLVLIPDKMAPCAVRDLS